MGLEVQGLRREPRIVGEQARDRSGLHQIRTVEKRLGRPQSSRFCFRRVWGFARCRRCGPRFGRNVSWCQLLYEQIIDTLIFSRVCGTRIRVEMSSGRTRRADEGRRGGGGPPSRRGGDDRRGGGERGGRYRFDPKSLLIVANTKFLSFKIS